MLLTSSLKAQQDKSKRPSPPAKVSETISSGATISIDYSQPSLKGRSIGTSVEPMKDKVWRMGANEATIFDKLSKNKFDISYHILLRKPINNPLDPYFFNCNLDNLKRLYTAFERKV